LQPPRFSFLISPRHIVAVSIVCIDQKPITQFLGNTDLLNPDRSWLKLAPEVARIFVHRYRTDHAEKAAFRGGMQSLRGLSGGQRSLAIALSQRLPGS